MGILAGCGSSAKYAMSTQATADAASYMNASYAAEEYAYDTGDVYESESSASYEGSDTPEVQDTSRKLIKNVDLDVETEEFDSLLQTIQAKTESFGGYIESSNTYNGSYYYGRSSRNASLTLRIPADALNDFLSTVAEVSNITRKSESVFDVTLQYVDMESHKNALETEQTRLLELLDKAESVEDIITIESRLSDVRYQLESMESQLRTMDNQVNYSTVSLYIEEVTSLTPVEEQSLGEKIRLGFLESIRNVGSGIVNFFAALIIKLPYILVWLIILFFAVKLLKALRKAMAGRKEKKPEKKKENEQNQEQTDKEEKQV
jgi:hypothetical protein